MSDIRVGVYMSNLAGLHKFIYLVYFRGEINLYITCTSTFH